MTPFATQEPRDVPRPTAFAQERLPRAGGRAAMIGLLGKLRNVCHARWGRALADIVVRAYVRSKEAPPVNRKRINAAERRVRAAVTDAVSEYRAAMTRDPRKLDLWPLNVAALFQRVAERHGVSADDIALWCAEQFIVSSASEWIRKGFP
jgi:hypothetical protein